MAEMTTEMDDVVENLHAVSIDNSSNDTSSPAADQMPHDDVSRDAQDDVQAAVDATVGLADMAGGVLRCLVCLLEQRDMVALAVTCGTLNGLQKKFAAGQEAFPLGATVDERHGNEDNAVEVDMDTMVCRKAIRPGMGTILAKERVDRMTCYWEVKIETFTGIRLDIGVATRRCIRRGGLDKNERWVFDCYGRACHGDRIRGYGSKVKEGDVVGVLLNTADNSLSFFLQGVCMGTAFRNVRVRAGLGLYPLLVVPCVAHETVRLLRHPEGDAALFPAPVRGLLQTRREWHPRRHEHDSSIIVETYEAQVIHRLGGMDPNATTVGGLKEALVRCRDMTLFAPGQLALRTRGALLTDDSELLSSAGVHFSSQGAQLQDIYLYVPHLIS